MQWNSVQLRSSNQCRRLTMQTAQKRITDDFVNWYAESSGQPWARKSEMNWRRDWKKSYKSILEQQNIAVVVTIPDCRNCPGLQSQHFIPRCSTSEVSYRIKDLLWRRFKSLGNVVEYTSQARDKPDTNGDQDDLWKFESDEDYD